MAISYTKDDSVPPLPELGGEFYRELFERSSERLVVLEVSADAKPVRFLAVSDEACAAFGASRDEILSIPPGELRLDPLADCDVQSDLLAGENVRLVTTLAGSASGTLDVEVVARLAQLDGRICLIASARDGAPSPHIAEEIEDRRDQLARSEELARVGTVKWRLNEDRHVWSDGYYRLLGLEPGSVEPCLESFLERVHPDDRKLASDSVEIAIEVGRYVEKGVRVVWPDGTTRLLRGSMTVDFDTSGRPSTLYVTAQDITEEEELLEARRKSEEGLAAAQELARIGSIDWNLRTGTGTWSDQYYRILGVEPGEVEPGLGTYLHYVHPDDRQFVLDGLRTMHETGQGRTVDVRIIAEDGQHKIITATTEIVCDDDGEPCRQFTTIQDVTEIKQLQDQLRRGEAFMAKAQEIAHLGSWEVDLASGRVTWSDELYRICGIAQADWDGRVESFLDEICHPDDVEIAAAVWTSMLDISGPHEGEYRVVRPDGEARRLLTRGELFTEEDGTPIRVVGVSWDVTELRAAESALRRSEERFDLAAQGSSDGLWDWPDMDGDEYWVSPRYAELLGYEYAEFPPSAIAATQLIHPADLDACAVRIADHLDNRTPYDVELRMRTREGAYRWFRLRGQAYPGADGASTRMSGSLLDIEDRKKAEEKLVSYGEQLRWLAAGVSKAEERERRRIGVELHDRTIQSLGFLRVKLGELRASLSNDDRPPELLDEIFALADGTIRETRSLLGELSPPVLYELGFEPAVEWLTERAEQLYGYSCRVDCRGAGVQLDDDISVVLFQAVRELLANAGKHAAAGTVEVEVRRRGDELMVCVADDGVGFEPSASASESGPTNDGGFGLFSIRERIGLLGGALEIESTASVGTRVVLRVPVVADDDRPSI